MLSHFPFVLLPYSFQFVTVQSFSLFLLSSALLSSFVFRFLFLLFASFLTYCLFFFPFSFFMLHFHALLLLAQPESFFLICSKAPRSTSIHFLELFSLPLSQLSVSVNVSQFPQCNLYTKELYCLRSSSSVTPQGTQEGCKHITRRMGFHTRLCDLKPINLAAVLNSFFSGNQADFWHYGLQATFRVSSITQSLVVSFS